MSFDVKLNSKKYFSIKDFSNDDKQVVTIEDVEVSRSNFLEFIYTGKSILMITNVSIKCQLTPPKTIKTIKTNCDVFLKK